MEEKTRDDLLRENKELKTRLREAEETLRAIRNGEVDAVVVSGTQGEQVFTLRGVDYTYRRLIEELREGAVTLAGDGSILYSNQCFARMLKRPLERVVGSSIHRFIAPADLAMFNALIEHGRQGSAVGELTLSADDGSQVPVYLSFRAVQLEDEHVLCMVATDLTEQKRTEEIVAAERLSRCILDQAVEAIVVCNKNGKIIRASLEAHQLCDQNPLLQPFEALFPLQIASEQVQAVEEGEPFSLDPVLRGMCIQNREASFVRSDGHRFDLLLNAGSLVNEAENKTIGCVITLTDITERKQAEVELKKEKKISENIITTVPDSLIVVDRDLRIKKANLSFYNVFQPDPEKVIGTCITDILGDKDAKLNTALTKLSGTEDMLENFELHYQSEKLGERIFDIRARGILIAEEEEEEEEVLLVLEDITERKKAEEALKNKIKEVESLNELFVGREHRMVELKREVNALLEKLGQTPKYKAPDRVNALRKEGE